MPYLYRNLNDPELETLRSNINQRVAGLLETTAAESIKGENNFLNYIIQKDKIIFSGNFSKIYGCTNPSDASGVQLMCRVFEPNAKIDPNGDIFLKILRFIGRQSKFLIATFDIFYDDSNHTYLFQEYADVGNCLDYLRSGHFVDQKQMLRWANGIYQGLDFLGNAGIVHRSIRPKHLVLQTGPGTELTAKLTGFRDACFYWDPNRNDTVELPRRPWAFIRYANFQAPDSCGDENTTFNPVEADLWSFGATFTYLVSRNYPFDLNNCDDLAKIDKGIRLRLDACAKLLNENCRNWLYQMLQPDPKLRVKFHNVPKDPWFSQEVSTFNY